VRHERRRSDFCVKVDALALPSGETLFYRFRALGRTSRTGRTKTAPVGEVASLKFALASCSSYAVGYFAAYRHIADMDDLDAVIHVGDYIYEDAAKPGADVRTPTPEHELVTLDDYRARYACHRRDGDLQALHARHPMLAVWDDHEFVQNAQRNGDGSALGVEIVTPSIASELVLPEASRALIEAENAHVRYLDLAHRGFVVLDLTPERLLAEWHFLSDVTRPDGAVLLAARMRLDAGSRRLTNDPL
jgi:phosphodiesterase/alkaline phosphatase D-like protein